MAGWGVQFQHIIQHIIQLNGKTYTLHSMEGVKDKPRGIVCTFGGISALCSFVSLVQLEKQMHTSQIIRSKE